MHRLEAVYTAHIDRTDSVFAVNCLQVAFWATCFFFLTCERFGSPRAICLQSRA